MALEFYVEQADRSPHSGVVNEEIFPGELVHDDGDGVNVLTFAATDEDAGGHVGLARYDAQAFAREYEDEVRTPKYVPNDAQRERAQYQVLEDSAVLRIRTPADESATEPAVGHKDVVGVIDEGDADAPANAAGRIVEEGYSNGTTTYNRSNGNFKAVGVAYRPNGMHAPVGGDGYDEPVRVSVFADLKESQ